MIYKKMNPYEVIVREHGDHGFDVQRKDKIDFTVAFINEYQELFNNEINQKFKSDFKLTGTCSAWYIISSYGESMIYIYPSESPKITIDYINIPAQAMLSHGLIDLNNPAADINPEKINVSLPKQQAIDYYKSSKTNITVRGGDKKDSVYIGGPGNLKLNNFFKIVEFADSSDSFITILTSNLIIATSDPMALSLYNKAMEFVYSLKGPLLLSNTINFAQATDNAKKIASTFFNQDVQSLTLNSQSFKHAMAEKKLSLPAEQIALKIQHNIAAPGTYPFWLFKEDMQKLQELTIKEGLSKEYAAELVNWIKGSTVTGTILFYYSNTKEFVLQWILINSILMILIIILALIKVDNTPIIQSLVDSLSFIKGERYILPAILLAINAWIFSVKPSNLDVRHWILPALLLCINFILTVVIQKSFPK